MHCTIYTIYTNKIYKFTIFFRQNNTECFYCMFIKCFPGFMFPLYEPICVFIKKPFSRCNYNDNNIFLMFNHIRFIRVNKAVTINYKE